MNKRRLKIVADYSKFVPDELFDLEMWFNNTACETACGTVGCAIGHATQIPALKAEGFKHQMSDLDKNKFDCPVYVNKDGDEWKGWLAVQVFFEINWLQAAYLFDKDYYKAEKPTFTQVANRIRKVIANGFPRIIRSVPSKY